MNDRFEYKYVAAARTIINRWVQSMQQDAKMVTKSGHTSIRQWLERAAVDSRVIHENCDANTLFAEVLEDLGLVPEEMQLSEEGANIWNAVTWDSRLLEKEAALKLKEF